MNAAHLSSEEIGKTLESRGTSGGAKLWDRERKRAEEEGCLHWAPKEFRPPTGYLCAVTDPTGYVIEFSYGQPLGPGAEG